MKRLIAVLVFVASLAPLSAWADYVCGVAYFPGSLARTRLTTSTAANCGGTIKTYWICESTSTSSSCSVVSYTVEEQLALYRSLVSAADTQQGMSVGLTTCRNSSSVTCLYYVNFAQ